MTRRWSLRGRLLGALLAALGLLAPPVAAQSADPSAAPLEIVVLSSRADTVSGGDALVEIVVPTGADPGAVRVAVDGRDVSGAFRVRADGRFFGLVDGLQLGVNSVAASLPDGRRAALPITNHPITGPVFSGPQVQPWLCQTPSWGLGEADASCHVATPRIDYLYWPQGGSAFQAYDVNNPPARSQVAKTKTDDGDVVDYIVRRERGTINRGVYQLAILDDPARPFEPWAPQTGWNGKLMYQFGGGCAPNHRQGAQGETPAVMSGMALARGFAVATSTLNVLDLNCNDVVSAEMVSMVKEHIVESFGPIRYTVGDGCSGGSIQQHLIAANYPGLLDGLRPACSFPDVWSITDELLDCELLLRHFTTADGSPHLWGDPAAQAAVMGSASPSVCRAWSDVFGFPRSILDPRTGCTGTLMPADKTLGNVSDPPWAYDPVRNPTGTRCTLQDFQAAVFGRDPQTGFALRPWDNVGVQYGLKALLDGRITTEQFVDINEKIGGLDIDFDHTASRTAADPLALERAYRSGRVTDVRQLDDVPILDVRGSSNAEIHTDYHTWSLRDRLVRDNGHADNHVHWVNSGPNIPAPIPRESFLLVDRWLAAIEADTSAAPLAEKVVRHKPADAVDACYIDGNKYRTTDWSTCAKAFPTFGDARIAAGAPRTGDVLKCRLKPLDFAEYPLPIVFNPLQQERLRAAFPDGVCDWTQPGVAQQPSLPWMTFANGPGGQPLGPEPVSVPS